MDIRNFFSPNQGKKTQPQQPKSSDKSNKVKNDVKNQTSKSDIKSKVSEGEESQYFKSKQKSTLKKNISRTNSESPVIIDDGSDFEDVIENSQDDSKNKSKSKTEAKNDSKSKGSTKKDESREKVSTDSSKMKQKDLKPNNQERKHEKEKSKKDDQKDKGKIAKDSSSDKELERSSNHRTSKNEKQKGKGSEKKEDNRKRKQISSSESDDDTKIRYFESDDEDEEIIVSRRKSAKKSAKKSKVLDSDDEEDPLPVDDEPKRKRKKKDIVFIDESDEEKPQTALDKFVQHKPAVKSSSETKKKEVSALPKGKPTNVADFFGTAVASRSDRETGAVKRKHTELKKDEVIEMDAEMHDDDDFLATLDQLDGPGIKKVMRDDIKEETVKIESKEESLKIVPESPVKKESPSKTALKESSNTGESKKSINKSKSPKEHKAATLKKGKVYTMEVTRETPPSPVKAKVKAKEDTTPPKKQASTTPAKTNDDDDGFGPKRNSGYHAFKNRGGPLALGSKELPEGAENCLEGLTFVITGVLDSIERDEAKTLVEKHGGKVTGSVSRKTSYMVVGRDAGESKLNKARDLKVKQVDEDGLFDLIRKLPGKTSKYELQAKEAIKKEESLKKEAAKADTVSKRLESFKNTSSSSAKKSENPEKSKSSSSLFTQIKAAGGSEDGGEPSVSPASEAKLLQQSQSPSQRPKDAEVSGPSLLWVDKHKPTSLAKIVGQQGDKSNARKLLGWLKAWHTNVVVKKLKPQGNFFSKGGGDGAGCRAALLSGPPGIGKTTTATLACKELGFSYVELNASDTRSKRSLKEEVAEALGSQTLVDFMGPTATSSAQRGSQHAIIMDEVDGMAGNQDRGGLQELVQLIKNSKIPVICICNDRNSQKMRTLANYCFDLRFQRPRIEQIKGAMMTLAFKEGIKVPPVALNAIIEAANHDIRQVIHNLSMWSAASKTLNIDQVKADASKATKDIKMGPFDVCRKVFVSDEETRRYSLMDKSDLFFHDYSLGPLFVQENYPSVIPQKAEGSQAKHLSLLSRTADSLCDGDLVDRLVRRDGVWSLLPTQAMFASVLPGELMRGSLPQMAQFPSWLGRNSSRTKADRLTGELQAHMCLRISCSKRGLNLDYLPALRSKLTQPLTSEGSEGVGEVIDTMGAYDLVREDFDNVLELTKFPGRPDPLDRLDSKTKAAFTRQYNKAGLRHHYNTGPAGAKKKRARPAGDMEDGEEEEEETEEDREAAEKALVEAMKSKKTASKGGKGGQAKGQAKAQPKGQSKAGSSSKAKGKGKK